MNDNLGQTFFSATLVCVAPNVLLVYLCPGAQEQFDTLDLPLIARIAGDFVQRTLTVVISGNVRRSTAFEQHAQNMGPVEESRRVESRVASASVSRANEGTKQFPLELTHLAQLARAT